VLISGDPQVRRGAGGSGRAPNGDLSQLARLAQQGAAPDVEALLARVRTVAHRYARARLATYPAGAELVDDVTQDVCVAVLGALPHYRDRGRPFEAFVHGVASHKVADAQRLMSRAPVCVEQVTDLADEVDQAPSPEDAVVSSSEAASAAQLLERLPERLRDVMVLRIVSGLSADEVGKALDMTAGAVRVAQHRALQKMRAMVEQVNLG